MAGETSHRELELRLEMLGEDISAARGHPRLRALAIGPERESELRSTYFDSADLALRRAGIALRVRHDGHARIQTVKAGELAPGMLADRIEYESAVTADAPDLHAIPDARMRTRIGSVLRGRSLRPVFMTRMRRITQPLGDGSNCWNLEIDLGEICARQASVPIREIELELLRGDVDCLYACALELCASLPLCIGVASKADRGYALAASARAAAGAPAPDAPSGAATRFDAAATALRRALEQMARDLAPALASQRSEELWHARQALAELRSLIVRHRGAPGIEAPGTLRAELDWVAREVIRAAADSTACTRLLLELGRCIEHLSRDALPPRDP